MLKDEQLINLMISEPSWEDVIIKIVAEEKMDPWSIDICQLTDNFVQYLNKIENLEKKYDLKVPARFILVAAILVRMKSDILVRKKEKILLAEGEKPENPILKVLAQIPPLDPPAKRIPLRNVSLDELIGALRKAFDVKERRIERKVKIREHVEYAMPIHEEDITKRINKLLEQINHAIHEIEDTLKFSDLVKDWKKENIIKKFMPLLHLAQAREIELEQPELFEEIYVKKVKKEDIKEEKSK